MGINGKTATAVGVVVAGVVLAGWLMNQFRDNVQFIDDASNGYQGL